jgi:hypothetical protein
VDEVLVKLPAKKDGTGHTSLFTPRLVRGVFPLGTAVLTISLSVYLI